MTKKTLYEIYTKSKEHFSVGQTVCESNEYLLFKVFDELGRECALNLVRQKAIQSLVSDSDYLKKMELYIDYWKDKSTYTAPKIGIDIDTKKLSAEEILFDIHSKEQIVTLILQSSNMIFTGFISKIDNNFIFLECISESDADIFDTKKISKDDILLIEFNSIDNDVLLYAYKKLHS